MDVRLPLLVLTLIVVAPEAPAGGKGATVFVVKLFLSDFNV